MNLEGKDINEQYLDVKYCRAIMASIIKAYKSTKLSSTFKTKTTKFYPYLDEFSVP